ncbi:hypothetical protein [Vibrio parahaemolyticus]|uniref:hypothetical protein n=1 Tax=Vibrio parahaemolyticus TaxID=670 RepID=UPI00111FCE0A|nr:hypothetical protein [Vibrio parahaemolyticus]TOG45101.1 hypothetical protein CGJ00_23690 [Vibrio parahaemolyticus]
MNKDKFSVFSASILFQLDTSFPLAVYPDKEAAINLFFNLEEFEQLQRDMSFNSDKAWLKEMFLTGEMPIEEDVLEKIKASSVVEDEEQFLREKYNKLNSELHNLNAVWIETLEFLVEEKYLNKTNRNMYRLSEKGLSHLNYTFDDLKIKSSPSEVSFSDKLKEVLKDPEKVSLPLLLQLIPTFISLSAG